MAAFQALCSSNGTPNVNCWGNKKTAQVLIPFVLPLNSAGIKLASLEHHQ